MVALFFTTIAPVIKVIHKVTKTQGSHPVFGKNSGRSKKHWVRKNMKLGNASISVLFQLSLVFFWFLYGAR